VTSVMSTPLKPVKFSDGVITCLEWQICHLVASLF
jgi:hypothetical protein